MSSNAAAVAVDAASSSSAHGESAPTQPTRAAALLSAFTAFRTELDTHHAQRERVVKLSRDVTALSKQLIFVLHRVGAAGGDKGARDKVVSEAEGKMEGLRALFGRLQGEVRGADFWRYERSVSPGIQEYLEGFTFYYYLEHHTLPTLEQAQASLFPPAPGPAAAADAPTSSSADEPPAAPDAASPPALAPAPAPEPYFHVTVDDYLGGVADLTGELMRLAIASVGKNLTESLVVPGQGEGEGTEGTEGKGFADIEHIGRLVREIQAEMTPLAAYARWLPKKLTVLDQSLAKIENASYNLRIRGAEYRDSPAMLQALARREAGSGEGGGAGAGAGREEVVGA
ncbi:hypothetical protein JCM8208_004710 [Rhodotorula glutinis]